MTETKRPFNYRDVFRRSFESRCIRLIITAYQQGITEKSIAVDWDENDITEQLFEYISDNPERLKWKVSVNPENPLPGKSIIKEKGFAAKYQRIDMRFTSFSLDKEFRYFMEAKNLKENNPHLKRRYIDTGIDSFITGKYPNFFLAGYLLEGDLNNTVDGINKLIKKDQRENEILKRCAYKYHDQYYESVHSDAGILKHFILDFTIL